jgi:hypothetical protein
LKGKREKGRDGTYAGRGKSFPGLQNSQEAERREKTDRQTEKKPPKSITSKQTSEGKAILW